MHLEMIRQIFPEGSLTPEQDFLIGDTCLALTKEQREGIEGLSVATFQKGRVQTQDPFEQMIAQHNPERIIASMGIDDTLHRVLVLRASSKRKHKKLNFLIEQEVYPQVVQKVESLPEYHQWKNEKFEAMIFPALSSYFDPMRWECVKLVCPITLCFMLEPMQAQDGHVYEKNAILQHLKLWEERWGAQIKNASLSEEERAEILNNSPLQAGHITIESLRPRLEYYDEIFKTLVDHYNARVRVQKSIIALAETESPPLTTSQIEKVYACYQATMAETLPNMDHAPLTPKQVEKIIRFYTMDQEERNFLFSKVAVDVLQSAQLIEKKVEACAFLAEAVQLPRELQIAI